MPAPGRVGLIFDMDNTLLGSRIDFPAIRRSLGALLRGAGAASLADDALARRPIAHLVALAATHDRAQGTDLAAEMWQIIEAHEIAGLREALPLDGAPDVLAALRARGFRIAVLTNNAHAPALEALRAAGVLPQTEALVARDDVPQMKPAGDGVVEAVRRLGGLDRWYVIGDSWIDGAAAAEAGGRFIAYRRAEEELRDRGVRPWRAINHLSELLSMDLTG